MNLLYFHFQQFSTAYANAEAKIFSASTHAEEMMEYPGLVSMKEKLVISIYLYNIFFHNGLSLT